MIDRAVLTKELAKQVTTLEADLRQRAAQVPEVGAVVGREWQAAHDAGRTAHDVDVWADSLHTQVAVAWVLGTVFVRFCEDNGLLADPVLSGPGAAGRRAEEAQRAWFRSQPPERGDRDYVLAVFTDLAAVNGIGHVFEPHNPLWLYGPSEDAVRALLGYWREVDPDTGDLRRDLTDPTWDTRFLGDLYQDLSEHAKKQYALLQTPAFVESFILDRTLDPAIDEFGLDGFKVIDPACGSGHFLLGAFERLLDRWHDRLPQEGGRALAERALQSVYGIDLNPFATSIARFRLLLAALQAAGIPTLAETPNFTLHVAVGDSLLHGPPPLGIGQHSADELGVTEGPTRHLYATEDREVIHAMLQGGYHAVVANPPYIRPGDAAANAAYRRRYNTCYREYALSVPFMERLFDLAVRGADGRSAGFVGQITSNSFMKREFGKLLIERYLAEDVDLTHVLDTAGAYIPGHGTPTVILLGRNRAPVAGVVRVVLGSKGEPSRPTNSSQGLVWLSIVENLDLLGFENDYVTVEDLGRAELAAHPWSIGGGAAGAMARAMPTSGHRLSGSIDFIGYSGQTNADAAFLDAEPVLRRSGIGERAIRQWVTGVQVRDFRISRGQFAIFPYDPHGLMGLGELDRFVFRRLWRLRSHLWARRTFKKQSYREEGRPWWEWHQISLSRAAGPFLTFPSLATHNHFAVERGDILFNRHASFVKLADGAAVDDYLELAGPLNSAVGCVWMKQVFHDRGNGGIGGGISDEDWEPRYEFDGTKLARFPLPTGSALEWARRLDYLAHASSEQLPAAVAERAVPTRVSLDAARARLEAIRREMVAVQEELDWRCLYLYRVTDRDLSFAPGAVPPIDRGERAFEIVLAQRIAAGEVTSSWFERHGSTPITEVPVHWPEAYRERVAERVVLLRFDLNLAAAEVPEYKRRWNWEAWDDLEAEALKGWLLERLEDPRYWPGLAPRSAAQLADTARADPDLVAVAEVYAGSVDVDLTTLISTLVADEAVPFVAAWRHTESGLRRRAAWERTWELQRAEDRGEEVGPIVVPVKYAKGDFRPGPSWRLRGNLDVPKERFTSYPGLGRDVDPTPLVGLAGWDHLEQAQALAALYEQRRASDGWEAERLTPMLAGLAELVPWLQQWHDEPDADGTRMGDFFATFLAAELATHRLSPSDLAAWRPPEKTPGRRKAST